MSNRKKCVIIGGGGHAKTLLDALLLSNLHEVVGFLDVDPAMKGMNFLGVGVLGGNEHLLKLLAAGIRTAVIGVGGVGDNRLREEVFLKTAAAGFHIDGVVHPSAIVSPFASVDSTAQILAGTCIGPLSKIAVGAIVNTGAIVEHDCSVGDFAHLASGAILGGNVIVEKYAHLGSGSVVRQSLSVGSAAIVGSGAVVTKNIPPGDVMVGIPAKRLIKKN